MPNIPYPSLRYLKLKAKSLYERYAEGEPRAQRLIRKHWRGPPPDPDSLRLSDWFRVLASAFKCRDWPALKRGVELLEDVRDRSSEALSDDDLDGLVALMGASWFLAYWARGYVVEASARGHQAVLRGMKHRSARVRRACSDYLDHFVTSWDADTYDVLEESMADRNAEVRASVLHAMGCQRCKTDPLQNGAIELFLRGLSDSSQKVRRTALAGLGQFRSHSSVLPAFLNSLHDASAKVRKQAVGSLESYVEDPSVRDALIELLASETDPDVIRTALRSLRADARRLVGCTRAEVEQELGPAREMVRQAGKPDAGFFPIEALSDLNSVERSSGKWVRVLYDGDRARSVTTQEVMRAP